MLYKLFRQLLFTQDPEWIHDFSLKYLNLFYRTGLTRIFSPKKCIPSVLMGLEFKNRVGLAAGLDKNGDYIDALGALGFGFLEVGTVTPRPQPGNPPPRLFRLTRHQAIINRMGFNNKGVGYLIKKIRQARYTGIIGVNIGKNLTTPVEEAFKDYLYCLQKVYPHADYVTINISSPNTPGLRKLQYENSLKMLLESITDKREKLAIVYGRNLPLLVKIAPDLTDQELLSIAGILKNSGLEGVVATNTTLSRKGVENSKHSSQEGGLSGAPLKGQSTHVLGRLKSLVGKNMILVASGGVMSEKDARKKAAAGADLVQLYTGLIFSGPGLVKKTAISLDKMFNESPKTAGR